MAETAGLIQKVTIIPLTTGGLACFWVGAHPTNTEVFIIDRSDEDAAAFGAFKSSMVDALTSAYVNRQEVVIEHSDDDNKVERIRFEPS